MPAPVLLLPVLGSVASALRLPALAAWLAGLFAQVVAFFASFMSVKLAMQAGIITAVVGLTTGVFLTIKSLMTGLTFVLPPQFSQALSLIVPDNLFICFSAIVSAHTVRWVWIWQVHFIESFGSIK